MKGRIVKRCRRLPTTMLCQMLVLQAVLAQPAGAQARLRILVQEGEGARNVAQQISPRPMIVRVLDANNRPVEGATVTFTAPGGGPGGDFANDSPSVRVVTSAAGIANAGPYHPNERAGMYQIQVRAEFQGEMASALISQTNIERGKGHKKVIAIIAIAAAAAGAAVAAQKGSSSSSSSSPTITFGGTAVGAPKQ
jgi:hypothetical protein